MPSDLSIGYVLPTIGNPVSGESHRWSELRSLAQESEEAGFDTVWISDEFYWDEEGWASPLGWWECVAMLGAIGATTSKISVGAWVLSSLHRNVGLTSNVVETLDEICDGRFVFGFGAGHAGKVSKGFGYPSEKVVARYEEALQVLLPLLRRGAVDFVGEYQQGKDSLASPRGPSRGDIPVMLAGHGKRTIRLAVEHGDAWSCFATASSRPDAFSGLLEELERACEVAGRDPSTIGRSVGIWIEPTEIVVPAQLGLGPVVGGSVGQMVEAFGQFEEMGFSSVELLAWPMDRRAIEALAPVISELRS